MAEQIVTEEWRAVVGFEGQYEVSSLGRIRSIERRVRITEALGGSRRVHRRILQPIIFINRYHMVNLGRDNLTSIHSIVCAAFIGPRPQGHDINHIDCNKANNCVNNLEYLTRRDNLLHAVASGRTPRGSKHHGAKLTEKSVIAIRLRFARGELATALGKEFGVNPATIIQVISRRTWAHVLDVP